jgi:hypothetical protein
MHPSIEDAKQKSQGDPAKTTRHQRPSLPGRQSAHVAPLYACIEWTPSRPSHL